MALTVTVPAPAAITALANVPTTAFTGKWVIVPTAAAVAALAQVPTTSFTTLDFKMNEGKTSLIAGPSSAVNDFGGGLCSFYHAEEITLDMASITNPLSLSFPPNFVVVQVSARVTETITGASTWEIGSNLDTARYIVTNSNLDAGYTVTNNKAFDPSVAVTAGVIIGGQNEIYITTDAPAVTGKIRVGVTGFFFKPFTS